MVFGGLQRDLRYLEINLKVLPSPVSLRMILSVERSLNLVPEVDIAVLA